MEERRETASPGPPRRPGEGAAAVFVSYGRRTQRKETHNE